MADRVRELDTDLVVLGGDSSATPARTSMASSGFGEFHGRDGVVAVLETRPLGGPRPGRGRGRAQWRDAAPQPARLIRRGAAALAVGGVDDFTHGAVRPDEAFSGVAPDVPRVLISHNPDLIEYLPTGLGWT